MRKALLLVLALLSAMARAQSTDSVSQSTLDSIDAKLKLMKLQTISVSAPTVATTETSHSAYRFVTFGITYRFGKLDLEWQARGGAASQ